MATLSNGRDFVGIRVTKIQDDICYFVISGHADFIGYEKEEWEKTDTLVWVIKNLRAIGEQSSGKFIWYMGGELDKSWEGDKLEELRTGEDCSLEAVFYDETGNFYAEVKFVDLRWCINTCRTRVYADQAQLNTFLNELEAELKAAGVQI